MTPALRALGSGLLFAAVLGAAILSGCGGYPDRLTTEGWTLSPASLPAPEGWQEALAGVRERAPCEIAPARWGGVVEFTPEGFGRSADLATWWPGSVPSLLVAEASGLPGLVHGGCHVAQYLCEVEAVHDGAFVACAEGDGP